MPMYTSVYIIYEKREKKIDKFKKLYVSLKHETII